MNLSHDNDAAHPHPRRPRQDRPPRRRPPRAARQLPVRLASRSSEQPFDWYDESTWSATAAGIDTAYLAPPVGPTGLAQAGRFIKQAAAEGLRRVVLLSGRGVGSPGRDFAVYEGSLELEHAVKDSGADWTIVQPAWFAQGFSEDFFLDYVLAGELRLSAGDGAEAWIDLDDVGEVMTTALLDEQPYREDLRRCPVRAR